MRYDVEDNAGARLDVWLSSKLPELSRTRIQALIRQGQVTANGLCLRPNARLKGGERIEVCIPPAADVSLLPEQIPLDVLYEDTDLIVVNKQAGLVVHPAAGHASGTLVNALLHHCPDLAGIGGEKRPGIVHRLDKDTSGVMVAAKSDSAMAGLVAQFKAGTVHKEYLALVGGTLLPMSGTVRTLIGRSRTDRKKMSAQPARGREAVTHYAVVEVLGPASLVRVRIETGRTHQIRVHMAHIGHPVLGDRQYGARRGRRIDAGGDVPRQMLHAETLAFSHPLTRAPLSFTAPVPKDMEQILNSLRVGE